MPRSGVLGFALVLVSLALPGPRPAHAQAVISAVRPLAATGFQDEDDMCIWLHPTNLALSTIVVSDKAAGKLFVYDLQGATLQTIASSQPGNIDVRYNFRFGGQLVDIVAFNERGTSKICVYEVDRVTRLLTRIDNDAIATGNNYGFTLYRSPVSGRFYAFTGPEMETLIKQWELVDDRKGRIKGEGPLRILGPGGIVEGMLADDETGTLYMSQESGGIWKYSAEPSGDTSGSRIVNAGEHGLVPDVEGITLYYRAGGAGYLIVSSQGNDEFKVYDRRPPHRYLGAFRVDGNAASDGCDVTSLPLDSTFSSGAFVCHNGTAKPFADQLVKWSEIARSLGLAVDSTYWDPRRANAASARTAGFVDPS